MDFENTFDGIFADSQCSIPEIIEVPDTNDDEAQLPFLPNRIEPIATPQGPSSERPDQLQHDEMDFMPLSDWDQEKTCDEDPMRYIRWTMQWKATINRKRFARDTVSDLVVAPPAYWPAFMEPEIQKILQEQSQNKQMIPKDTDVVVSVTKYGQQSLQRSFKGKDIDWSVVEEQFFKWKQWPGQTTPSLRLRRKLRSAVLNRRHKACLPEFAYNESAIVIAEAVGDTPHYKIYKIIAGGKSYHLNAYKYEFRSMTPSGEPKSYTFFNNAYAGYAQLNTLSRKTKCPPISYCHGYINLSASPTTNAQLRSSRRPPSRPKEGVSHVCDEFVCGEPSGTSESHQRKAWEEYFWEKIRRGEHTLRGLVLDDSSTWTPLEDSRWWFRGLETWVQPHSGPTSGEVVRLIVKSLALVHSVGVVQGDARNMENIWLCTSGNLEDIQMFWTGFTLAKVGQPIKTSR